ncbi:MAG: ABC transporter ATP-binding protein [bacterium]|nr:ABC transporter ATP-binding protein [bacterium]
MENPLIYLLRKMWQYSGNNRRTVILYILFSAFATLLGSLDAVIIGIFLNTIQTEGVRKESLPHLLFLLGLLPVLEIVFWAFHGTSRVKENRNAFFVRTNYKNYLLQGTMALPMEWHTDHHSGDTIDKIEKGTGALFNFSERTYEMIQTFILLTIAFIVMFFFDPFAGGAALVFSLFTFYVIGLFDKKLIPGYIQVNRIENTISAKIFDALSNVTSVIILRVEPLILKSIDGFIKKPYERYNKNIKLNEWKWFFASILGRLTVVLVIGIYLYTHIAAGTILAGTVYILYSYTNQIRETFFRFAFLYNDIVRYRASVTNTEELSNDFRGAALLEEKHLPKTWSGLAIKNLSFSYHARDGADLHLDDINLKIKKGERVALIGESGGGKSTFLRLMRDLYHPKTLTLVIDGKEAPGGFSEISDSISLIPQDPEIFATTIRENITLGVEYTDQHIQAFTDMARFTEVFEKLPKGLESSIVEKGVNLSGGEKQRLALARGLLASVDKEIVLLDEPTSSVDFQNELAVYQNIFSAFSRKTIISSIHRLHLLSLFDTVYFFEGGKIIAHGSFGELKKKSSEFQKLWKKYIRTRDASGS